MYRLLILAMVTGLLAPWPATAQTDTFPQDPRLIVSLRPQQALSDGGFIQGQLVLSVRVASKFPFESLKLRMPTITGAQVIDLIKPRNRHVKTYAGDGFVHERILALFPVASGTFTVPPVAVDGSVAAPSGEIVRFTDRSQPIVIDIAGISSDYGDAWWLVSDQVEMSESWSKPPTELRVGDIVRREVSIIARGVTAEHVKMPLHRGTKGIRVTEAGGSSATKRTADGVVASLTAAWDLKIDRGGVVFVSPLGLRYFDPVKRQPAQVFVPGRRLEPLPADGQAIATAMMAEAMAGYRGRKQTAIILIAVALAPFAVGLVGAAWTACPTRADWRLWHACRGLATPRDIYGASLAWSRASKIGLITPAGPPDPPPPESFLALQARANGRLSTAYLQPVVADLIRYGRRRRLAAYFRRVRQVIGLAD